MWPRKALGSKQPAGYYVRCSDPRIDPRSCDYSHCPQYLPGGPPLRASPTQHLPGVPLPGIQITQSARFAWGGSGEQRRRAPPCPSGRVMHSMVITSDTLKRHKAPANGGKVDMAGRLASRHPHAGRWPVSAGASDDHTCPLAGPITRAGHVAANGSRSNNSPKGKSLYPGPLLVIIGSVPSSPAPQEKTDGQAAGLKGQLLL
jgi:hypothetical protein